MKSAGCPTSGAGAGADIGVCPRAPVVAVICRHALISRSDGTCSITLSSVVFPSAMSFASLIIAASSVGLHTGSTTALMFANEATMGLLSAILVCTVCADLSVQ